MCMKNVATFPLVHLSDVEHCEKRLPGHGVLSTCEPVKGKVIKKPQTKMEVRSKAEYPLTSGFPSSLQQLTVRITQQFKRILLLPAINRLLEVRNCNLKLLTSTLFACLQTCDGTIGRQGCSGDDIVGMSHTPNNYWAYLGYPGPSPMLLSTTGTTIIGNWLGAMPDLQLHKCIRFCVSITCKTYLQQLSRLCHNRLMIITRNELLVNAVPHYWPRLLTYSKCGHHTATLPNVLFCYAQVSGCELRKFDSRMLRLHHLTHLSLANNKLEKLPEEIASMRVSCS